MYVVWDYVARCQREVDRYAWPVGWEIVIDERAIARVTALTRVGVCRVDIALDRTDPRWINCLVETILSRVAREVGGPYLGDA